MPDARALDFGGREHLRDGPPLDAADDVVQRYYILALFWNVIFVDKSTDKVLRFIFSSLCDF